MKKIQFLIFILLLAFTPFLPIKVATAKLKATLEGHTDNVWSVAFSPNGQTLASGSYDQTIRLWNVNTGHLLHTLTGHTNEVMSVAFSPDGQTLASASWDATIRLWNPHNGRLKRILTGHTDGVASVVFSPDGQTLASGSADQTVRLWNTTTWKLKNKLIGHTHVVDSVAFSPAGDILASGSRDATIRLWNPKTGNTQKTLTELTDPVKFLAFTPDGQTLASASWDKTIRLWSPKTGKLKEILPDQTGWVNPVVFSPDGETLLIGGRGISVWDTETDQYKIPLATDVGHAVSIVFSSDGRMVASGSADNKIRLWEFAASDYEIPSITTNGTVRLVYFLPNDRPIRSERVTALRRLIKETQEFYADEMERHGYGRKTFRVETDTNGEPVVHRIDGKFGEDHYYQTASIWNVWAELPEHFEGDDFQHAYLIAIDLSREALDDGKSGGSGGLIFLPRGRGQFSLRMREITQREEVFGGLALIPSHGYNFDRLGLTVHEIGHAFGLVHDFRKGLNSDAVMAGGKQNRLSKCAAEWLSVSRFFNNKPVFQNELGEIQLLPIRTYNQNTISLRFQVTDPDGLHQAQLLVPYILNGTGEGAYQLFDCKQLNGETDTIESAIRTVELVDRVTLQIMDVSGNITWTTFPIKLDEIVSAQNLLDINADGTVNISDLISIASRYGQRGKNPADINEDRVVNIVDLLLVASGLSSVPQQAVETLSASDVQKWINDAEQLGIENEFQQKGLLFLEHLLRQIDLSPNLIGVATRPLKAIFAGHTGYVWSVAFSPDGQTLASGSWDQTIQLWDPQTEQLKATLTGHTTDINSIAFSPDGQTLASGSAGKTVHLWNAQTGKLKRTLREHAELIASIAFSPDGQTLASGSADKTIRLWNTRTGKYKIIHTGQERITSIAFSPDGKTLASGSADQTIRLWNTQTGKLKRTLTGHTRWVLQVTFSPDGKTLASSSSDGTIRLWNTPNGKLKKTLTGYGKWVNSVAFSPDGQTLACGGYNIIHLLDMQTGEYKNTLETDTGHTLSIAFSPDGTTLASGGEDGTVRLWELTPDDTSSDNTIEDVNGDGVVDFTDAVVVVANLGQKGLNDADVNADGIVDVEDLLLVLAAIEAAAGAPALHTQAPNLFTAEEVQRWLVEAKGLANKSLTHQRGILMLEQLLALLTPKETSLLPNYPNPFNPETWMPYQLSEPAEVTLRIYAVDGRLIRTLVLGYQPAGMYQSKSRAAHWDGRNELGEPAASSVYFYTFTAGDFSATRKMLIRK